MEPLDLEVLYDLLATLKPAQIQEMRREAALNKDVVQKALDALATATNNDPLFERGEL